MWRKGNPGALLVGRQIDAVTIESSVDLLQNIKMDLLYDPTIPLMGIYPKNPKTLLQKIYAPLCALQCYVQ